MKNRSKNKKIESRDSQISNLKKDNKGKLRKRKLLATGGIVTTLFLSGGFPSSTQANSLPTTLGSKTEAVKGKFEYTNSDLTENAVFEDNLGFVDSIVGEIGEKNSRDLLEAQGFSPSQINKILKDY